MKKQLDENIIVKILRGDFENSEDELSKMYNYSDKNNPSICFDNLTFTRPVWIRWIECKYRIIFSNCKFLSDLRITGVKFESIVQMIRCDFGLVEIRNSIGPQINFSACTPGSLHIGKSYFKRIELSTLGGQISLTRLYALEVIIGVKKCTTFKFDGSNSFVSRILFTDNIEEGKIRLEDLSTNILDFSNSLSANAKIEIFSSETRQWLFREFQNKGEVIFNDIKIKKVSIEIVEKIESQAQDKIRNKFLTEKVTEPSDINIPLEKIIENIENIFRYASRNLFDYSNQFFFKEGKSYVHQYYKFPKTDLQILHFDNHFGIHVSNLGLFTLRNIDFEMFNYLEINKTDLSSIQTFNSTIQNNEIKGSPKARYETFNNLYTVAKRKNNKSEEISYYKSAQSALLKSFTSNKGSFKIASIISLTTSKAYSLFGTSWTRALLVTMIIGIFFFLLMLRSAGSTLNFSDEGWSNFWTSWRFFWQFLNPTHNITFMDGFLNYKYSQNGVFVGLDFFGRILVAIGIFEIIRSFRMYVRK